MLRDAKEEVTIMSSYFIPSGFFRNSISAARKRGVTIRLILASLSDVGLAKNAERYFYRWAVLHGIEIYEYKLQVLHGKVALCDGRFMTIGSYNVNDISALASIELNLDVDSSLFVGSVKNLFDSLIKNECNRIDEHRVLHGYSSIERIKQWSSYMLFRIIFRLFTFYFAKKHKGER
jgi:cardiolipin synthase A/B